MGTNVSTKTVRICSGHCSIASQKHNHQKWTPGILQVQVRWDPIPSILTTQTLNLESQTRVPGLLVYETLRVQVPNNHILTQNLYYNYYYPKPKYLIIGYLDPLGKNPGRVSGVCLLTFRTWHAAYPPGKLAITAIV